MTAELNVRFRKQIPLGQPLQVVGELVRLRSRTMEGKGEIRLADGSVGATAEAKYILLPDEEVEAFKEELDYWRVVPEERDEGS